MSTTTTTTTDRKMKRPGAPSFSNPFSAPRGFSSDKINTYPSLATPFAEPRHTAESTTSSVRDPNSPFPDTPGSALSRKSSFFNFSMSMNGANGATSPSERSGRGSIFSRKGSIFGSGRHGSGSSESSSGGNYMLEATGRPTAVRRPSYVPKYAAASHLASMTGRTTSTDADRVTDQLRRGSRMMSIVPGEMGAPSRLIHSAVLEGEETA